MNEAQVRTVQQIRQVLSGTQELWFAAAQDDQERCDWLSRYQWDDLEQVQDAATQWMWHYNHERQNMALGGITPKQRLAMTA